jgi:hypothetical protein
MKITTYSELAKFLSNEWQILDREIYSYQATQMQAINMLIYGGDYSEANRLRFEMAAKIKNMVADQQTICYASLYFECKGKLLERKLE